MAILKRRSISITHEYRDVYEFLENTRYNLSKYVCDLIREDMEKNKELYNLATSSKNVEEDIVEDKEEEIIEEIDNTNEEENNDDIKIVDASWLD